MSFGDLDGVTVDKARAERPDLVDGLSDPANFEKVWPGGESRRSFHERVAATFRDILHAHEAERIIVVSHGGVIGAFLSQITGKSPNDPDLYDLVNCGLTHVEVRGDHTLLHLQNDASHLADLVDPDDGEGGRP
jgi:broad specificity phosphatase PhoE